MIENSETKTKFAKGVVFFPLFSEIYRRAQIFVRRVLRATVRVLMSVEGATCRQARAVGAPACGPVLPRAVRSQADLPGRPSDGPRDPCAWEGPARPDDDREKDLGCSLRGRTRPSFSLSSSDAAMISNKLSCLRRIRLNLNLLAANLLQIAFKKIFYFRKST